eukprot:scaffold2799_cov408-Prasinococcus_capsulatus_cf.AAC.20
MAAHTTVLAVNRLGPQKAIVHGTCLTAQGHSRRKVDDVTEANQGHHPPALILMDYFKELRGVAAKILAVGGVDLYSNHSMSTLGSISWAGSTCPFPRDVSPQYSWDMHKARLGFSSPRGAPAIEGEHAWSAIGGIPDDPDSSSSSSSSISDPCGPKSHRSAPHVHVTTASSYGLP